MRARGAPAPEATPLPMPMHIASAFASQDGCNHLNKYHSEVNNAPSLYVLQVPHMHIQ